MAIKMLVRDTVTGVCGVADVPCPPAPLTAQSPIMINGTVIQLNLNALMTALNLRDCDGALISTAAELATCANVMDMIADAIAALPADRYVVSAGTYNPATNTLPLNMSTGPAVNLNFTALINDILASIPASTVVANAPLTGNGSAGSPLDINFAALTATDVAALMTSLNLRNCAGVAHASGATIPTCAEMTAAINAAIAALPGDKFLQGLQSYNPTTNVMTLLMNDGSTVAVNMTGLLNDAVSSALAAIDGSETKVTAGANITVTGTGTVANPYVISGAAAPSVTACSLFGTAPVTDPRPNFNPDARIVGLDGVGTAGCGPALFEVATYNDIEGAGVAGQEDGPQKILTVSAISLLFREDNTNNIHGVGFQAAQASTGTAVDAVGGRAGINNTGSTVSLIGQSAGYNNSGDNVSAGGHNAAYNNSGDNVSVFGAAAGFENSGNNVSASGRVAAYSNSGNDVNGYGYAAAFNNSGNTVDAYGNAAAFQNAGNNVNTAGRFSAYKNIGDFVQAYGEQAGFSNSGDNVSLFGFQSGYANTGSSSDFYGSIAGFTNTGNAVSAFGRGAAFANSGDNVSAGGEQTLYFNWADNVSAFGNGAGNGPVLTSELNSVITVTSPTTVSIAPATAAPVGSIVTVGNATNFAARSFVVTSPTVLTMIVGSGGIGNNALSGGPFTVNLTRINCWANNSYFGNAATGTGPNQAVLGGPTQTPCGWGAFTVISDERDKKIEKRFTAGDFDEAALKAVASIDPILFALDPRERYTVMQKREVEVEVESAAAFDPTADDNGNGNGTRKKPTMEKKTVTVEEFVTLDKDGSLADNRAQLGFSAQNVQEVAKALGVDPAMLGIRDMQAEGGSDKLLLNTDALIAVLFMAVRALAARG